MNSIHQSNGGEIVHPIIVFIPSHANTDLIKKKSLLRD